MLPVRLVATLTLLAGPLTLLAACGPKAAGVGSGGGPVVSRPLNVWDVEKNGKRSVLLGTCHLGASLDYAFPKPDSAVIEGSRVVYTEADLGAMSGAEALGKMWSSERLSQRLSPAAWTRVIRGMPELPASILDHFPPWLVGTLGGMQGALGDMVKKGDLPMDLEVQRRAEAKGVPVLHVETLAMQIGLLSGFDDAFIAALEAAPDPAAAARAQAALDDLCMAGGADLAALIDPTDPTTEPMLFARNEAWMPVLVPELEQGGAFVAVGAAHMLGERGLLALVEQHGFVVTRHSTMQPRKSSAAFSVEPPAPEVDEARVAAFTASLVPLLVGQLCGESGVVRQCFVSEPAACEARVATDAAQCVSQSGAALPEKGAPSMPLITTLSGCAVTGVVTEAMVNNSFGEAPMCQSIKAGMAGALAKPAGG
ncbi:hypothetical protein LBMAG42_48380 [Deltaproteobacteria bacterium]|nr:hypothetical protein LBMAG42_48380 [Deltaproteobacteria bacterium]